MLSARLLRRPRVTTAATDYGLELPPGLRPRKGTRELLTGVPVSGPGESMGSDGRYLNLSAWPYTQEELEQATHIHQLPRRDTVTLNLDLRQMGVGGDDGWTERARPHWPGGASPSRRTSPG